jgi:hypothetical protein
LDVRNKHRDAVKVFTKLKLLIPSDLEVQRQLARALRRGGNVEGSLDVLEQLLDKDGEYLPALVDYAWLLEKTMRCDVNLIYILWNPIPFLVLHIVHLGRGCNITHYILSYTPLPS